MANIPTVDFSPFMRLEGAVVDQSPTPAQLSTAAAINAAFVHHGFLFLSGIGVTPQQLASYFSMASSIFSLADEYKRTKLIPLDPVVNVGYTACGMESLNNKRPADIKEAYNVRNTRLFDHDFSALPSSVEPTFRHLWRHLETVSQRFALACAIALGLPLTFFSRALQSYGASVIRLNYYPPTDYRPGLSTGENLASPLRVGEHTDFGMFTILFNDAPGLQVKAVQGGEIGGSVHGEIGGWLDVPVPSRATAIVNTGALMARWTNDVWRATAHRVVVTSEQQAREVRFSVACFFDPDPDSVIEVHPKFVPEGDDPKYEPISARDYEWRKLKEARLG